MEVALSRNCSWPSCRTVLCGLVLPPSFTRRMLSCFCRVKDRQTHSIRLYQNTRHFANRNPKKNRTSEDPLQRYRQQVIQNEGPVPNQSAQAPNFKHGYRAIACRFNCSDRIYRYSRMSSKYIVPAPPPGAGAFFVPMPIVIVFTFIRSTPNVARSMTHSVQPVICVAAGSSW